MNLFTRRCLFSFVAVALLATAPLQTHAQNDDIDLGGALDAIGRDYAKNYAQPLTDALGGGMNGGLFRTASFDGTGIIPGIDLYVGVAAMGTFTSGSASSFRLDEDQVETNQGETLTISYPDEDLPTVFGEEESPTGDAIISDGDPTTPNQSVELPPALINTSIAPLAVPQIGIGTAFGTDVQVRYLPEREFSDYGSVSLRGLSVRHSLSQYVPGSPVSLAVQGTWQSLGVSSAEQDDIVEASGWAVNALISKSIPVLTLYGGLQYEKFDVDVNYTFDTSAGQSEISLSQEAQNNFRAVGGVSLSLFLFRINADYALGANNVASVGVGVIL